MAFSDVSTWPTRYPRFERPSLRLVEAFELSSKLSQNQHAFRQPI
jgi:hypothetical protein